MNQGTGDRRLSGGGIPASRLYERGFSLVELGIVVAVVAVLSIVVIAGKGYIDAAKKQATIDLVQAIRTASQQYAIRYHNGVAFAQDGLVHNAVGNNISMTELENKGFLSEETQTPWRSKQITVTADNGTMCGALGGTNCTKCAGYACVYIKVPIGNAPGEETLCNDLGQGDPSSSDPNANKGYFSDKAIAAKCTDVGQYNLELVTR